MKASLICFSREGAATMERLSDGLASMGYHVSASSKSRYLPSSISCSVGEWTGQVFSDSDVVVYIGATGIAVRSIAPYIVSKKQDPAVLVVDEGGRYVISLLSGHLGGANEAASQMAGILGAQPIITTATDLEQHFAVDVFARDNLLWIPDLVPAKEVSAALLAGKPVGFYSELPWRGTLPRGIVLCDKEASCPDGVKPEVGFAVTIHRNCHPFATTARLVPKAVTLGVGCRKNKDAQEFLEGYEQWMQDHGLEPRSIAQVASIDLKQEEEAILSLCKALSVPFLTYSAKELLSVPGEFTISSFVRSVTGVDNVCERSALRAVPGGSLLYKKQGFQGMTIAAALASVCLDFGPARVPDNPKTNV